MVRMWFAYVFTGAMIIAVLCVVAVSVTYIRDVRGACEDRKSMFSRFDDVIIFSVCIALLLGLMYWVSHLG